MVESVFAELAPMVGTKDACAAVGRPRAGHYRHCRPPLLGPERLRPRPPKALSDAERAAVLAALHEPRFVDRAPAQVWATPLDARGHFTESAATDSHEQNEDRDQVEPAREVETRPSRFG